MINQRVLTPGAITVVLILSMLMWIGASSVSGPLPDSRLGLCVPSPNLWVSPGSWSAALNALLIACVCLTVFLINKRYNLLHSDRPYWSLLALAFICSLLPAAGAFNSMPIVAGGFLIVVVPLFESYRSRNATRNIFFAATWIGIGSMMQQAFILLIPAFIASMFAMGVARLREFMAFMMGLAAPYWIAFGFGWLSPQDFRLPVPSTIFSSPLRPEFFPTAVGCGIMMLCSFLLSLYNAMKLYAGNSRIRNFNNVINLFGLASAIGLLMDPDNFRAYCGIFSVWTALQLANLFTLWPLRRPKFLLWTIVSLIFISAAVQFAYLFP